MPTRTASASGWPGSRSQSRGPGPSAVRSSAAGSGQLGCGLGRGPLRLRGCFLGRHLAAAAGQPPGPGAYPAAPSAGVGRVRSGVLGLVRPGQAFGEPGAAYRRALPPARRRRLPVVVAAVVPVPGGRPQRVEPAAVRLLTPAGRTERGRRVAEGVGRIARRRAQLRGGTGLFGACRAGGDPEVAVAVRDGGEGGLRLGAAGGEPQGGLADPQQRAGREPDRPGADLPAVEAGAVRGVQVGDAHPAVLADRHLAVLARDVGIVQRDVRLRGAADADAAAVQQVDAARVGTRHHVQPGRGRAVVGRLVLGGGGEREHRSVHQGWLTQDAALGVEPLAARVQHHGSARDLRARGGRGQAGCDGRECRPRRGGDEHVAGARRSVAAARREDGQPDLHRLGGPFCAGVPRRRNSPVIPPTRHTIRAEGILAPATDNTPVAHLYLILIGRLGTQMWTEKWLVATEWGISRRCRARSFGNLLCEDRVFHENHEKTVNKLVAPTPRPVGTIGSGTRVGRKPTQQWTRAAGSA